MILCFAAGQDELPRRHTPILDKVVEKSRNRVAMPHYDLHSHTYFSDGTLSPADLVLRAKANGVEVLALTDHDVTDGIAEAELAAAEVGLTLVPGVEVSVTWGSQTIHVVGLGVDRHATLLQDGLKGLREFRAWRAEEIGRRLAKKGVAGAFEGASALARCDLVSRTHFAHFLVAEGYAKDVRAVFKKYLVSGKPGYVPGEWASLEQAVNWIRAAGGQAVIAHPARYKLNTTHLHRLLTHFKEVGGEAIEVASGSHSRDDCFRFAAIAAKYQLLSSCGSDYHGPESNWTDLGRLAPLPEQCIPVWRDWTLNRPAPDTAVLQGVV
jgi:predicted metal-dependent phosphoesterase TrpH